MIAEKHAVILIAAAFALFCQLVIFLLGRALYRFMEWLTDSDIDPIENYSD